MKELLWFTLGVCSCSGLQVCYWLIDGALRIRKRKRLMAEYEAAIRGKDDTDA